MYVRAEREKEKARNQSGIGGVFKFLAPLSALPI